MSGTLGLILAVALVLVVIVIFENVVVAFLIAPILWCYDLVFRKRPVHGWRRALAIIYGIGLIVLCIYSAVWAIPAFLKSI